MSCLLITRKFLFWNFRRWKIRSFFLFFNQKVRRSMILTDYWKVLVLNFSKMRNTDFFQAKELMERWYLLITKKFVFWTFPRWEMWYCFEPKSWSKMIFTNYWIVLVLNFPVMGNTGFFHPKSWWKGDIYLIFLNFPCYSRTWEIWFFVQCELNSKNLSHW